METLSDTAPKQSPTGDKQRVNSLDVLRGVAVLAIFAVNIKMMANGFNHYRYRALWEGEGAQIIGFVLSNVVHGKFVTIFTALFGAGLALLLDRPTPVPTGTVLRRLFWLAAFGAVHLIFIREGDILIWYALAGFLAIIAAKRSPQFLFVAGFCLHVAAFVNNTYFSAEEAGIPILWSAEDSAHLAVSDIMLGPVSGHIAARLEAAPYYMVDLYLLGGVWIDTLGTMLIGMALLKTGFLTGALPVRRYILWGVLSFAVAILYDVLSVFLDPDSPVQGAALALAGHAHYAAGALVWSALIIGAVAAGLKATRLAAVGRTAFTVYILQSVIGLVLFSSLGLGLFGQLSLPQLMLITGVVWAFFLWAAPLWLRHFRFGPLEWMWRSLTYRQRQPFRRM